MTAPTLLLWLAACGLFGESGPAFVEYEVVRGDTLFLIAKAHDVTVDDLRAWNGIEGDLIEVGQVLKIGAGTQPAPKPAGKRSTGKKVGGSVPPTPEPTDGYPPLVMPAPKPCLAGPSEEGVADVDEAMVGNAGLDPAAIKSAMNAFLPQTLRCLEGDVDRPTQTLMMDITVACSGQVEHIAVTHSGDWTPEVQGCVTNVLTHTPFPAHDLPDGEIFAFPLTFTAE